GRRAKNAALDRLVRIAAINIENMRIVKRAQQRSGRNLRPLADCPKIIEIVEIEIVNPMGAQHFVGQAVDIDALLLASNEQAVEARDVILVMGRRVRQDRHVAIGGPAADLNAEEIAKMRL